jgi:hypothetical protein
MQAKGRGESRRAQTTRWALGSTVLLTALAALAPGAAQGAPRAEMTLRFAAQKPGAVSSMHLGVVYRGAGEPDGKPSPIHSATIEAPAGTRLASASIPPCAAGDEEFRARGRDACPAESRLGAGTLTAITGFGRPFDPFPTEVTVFKTAEGWVEVVQRPETSVGLGADRARIKGSTVVLSPPPTPGGPPDGRTAIRDVDLDFPATGFVMTPPACPADGLWRSRGSFTFEDGVTATATATTPCRGSGTAARGARPAMRVLVIPSVVRAGRRTRFGVRVSSADPRCRRGAAIWIGGRRPRTDARGRAKASLAFRAPGRHAVVARKAGCRRATATIVVRRA